ncbi:MAG: DUF1295 domain-containing protein [Deltaproteobacteria bacterium]|nr:DUF1295 domain-containing protein [Deltaproteobacteria bacterium]
MERRRGHRAALAKKEGRVTPGPWLSLVLQAWLLVAVLMTLLWMLHFPLKNAAIVDVGWALGLVLIAWLYACLGPGYPLRKTLLAAMVGAWGLRLAIYLLFARVIGQEEEGRYREIRRNWRTNVGRKFFLFFQFQALLDVFLSLPFLFVALNPTPRISLLEWAGLGLAGVSILGESLADWQLHRFKSDPRNKGKTCQRGLWQYSRHPNYFFEWLIWCAYFLFALASPHGAISILCPLLMLFFLFRVTGIPATEAQALRSRGEEYRRYQKTTSAFIPWFPKKVGP